MRKHLNLICLILILICVAFVVKQTLLLPQISFKNLGKPVTVKIDDGMTAYGVSKKLKSLKVIQSARLLSVILSKSGIDKSIKAGQFDLYPCSEFYVANQLKNLKPAMISVMLLPGITLQEFEKNLAKYNESKSDVLLSALADDKNFPKALRDVLPKNPQDRFIFLLPETYNIASGSNIAKHTVKAASAVWYKRIGSKIPAESFNQKRLFNRGTMASVIELEAKYADERPILAGIFDKRIESNMRLQSCATVIYAWERKTGVRKKSLLYKDLEIDDPYNTYKNDGLPPTPICVPSEVSWNGALYPTKTDYLFFFAGKDGKHIFSKTYKEHLSKQQENK